MPGPVPSHCECVCGGMVEGINGVGEEKNPENKQKTENLIKTNRKREKPTHKNLQGENPAKKKVGVANPPP